MSNAQDQRGCKGCNEQDYGVGIAQCPGTGCDKQNGDCDCQEELEDLSAVLTNNGVIGINDVEVFELFVGEATYSLGSIGSSLVVRVGSSGSLKNPLIAQPIPTDVMYKNKATPSRRPLFVNWSESLSNLTPNQSSTSDEIKGRAANTIPTR